MAPITGKIRRTCTTKHGLIYDYDGFWFVAEDIIAWRAHWIRAKLSGMLHGHIKEASSFKSERLIDDEVSKRISAAIEDMGDRG